MFIFSDGNHILGGGSAIYISFIVNLDVDKDYI